MTLEEHVRTLIVQYQKLQKRHTLHAQNAYYKFQSDMWQAMADDFGIIVEDLQNAIANAEDIPCAGAGPDNNKKAHPCYQHGQAQG